MIAWWPCLAFGAEKRVVMLVNARQAGQQGSGREGGIQGIEDLAWNTQGSPSRRLESRYSVTGAALGFVC